MKESESYGTLRWRAPETFQTSEWSRASDIFSLGMVFYEIVTRKLPFATLDDSVVSRHIVKGVRDTLPEAVNARLQVNNYKLINTSELN